MGEGIPEEDAAFHDAELISVRLGKSLLIKDMREDRARLLRVCRRERLVEGFEQLVERGRGPAIEKSSLYGERRTFCLGLDASFSLLEL